VRGKGSVREHSDLSHNVDNSELFCHRRDTARERCGRETDVASHGTEEEGLRKNEIGFSWFCEQKIAGVWLTIIHFFAFGQFIGFSGSFGSK